MIEGPQIPDYQKQLEEATVHVLGVLGVAESSIEKRLTATLSKFLAQFPDIHKTREWGGLDIEAQTTVIGYLFFHIALIVEEDIKDDEQEFEKFTKQVTDFFHKSEYFQNIQVIPIEIHYARDEAEQLLINNVPGGNFHNYCWDIIQISADILFASAYFRARTQNIS